MDLLTLIAASVVAITLYFLVQKFTTPSHSSQSSSSAYGGKSKESEKGKEKEKKEEDVKVPLKIFFGSQTGTAEEFANSLADEAVAYGFAPEVVDLEDLCQEDLAEVPLAIFALATYGDGEPTDNARPFHEWISKDDQEEGYLNGLKFTIFGLGNKTYERYNWMAKETQTSLKKHGATEVYRLGLGDDDQSLEEDFDKWKRDLWAALCTAAGLPVLAPANIVKQRRYEMTTYDTTPEKLISHFYQAVAEVETSGKHLVPSDSIFSMNHKSYKTYDTKNPFLGRVIAHRELHSAQSDRSCMHIEVELIKNAYLRYSPGDHIGIFPENDSELVEEVGKRLGVNLDTIIKLTPAGKAKAPTLGPFTIRRALSTFCDITTRPRQSFLREIAQYAHDDEEKARLLRLGDTSNDAAVAEYQQYIMRDYRSIVDILDEFHSLHPPIDVFIELCPRLDPRFYSISSAMDENPSVVSITAVVVEVPKRGGKRKVHKGVCTNWMKSLQPHAGNVFVPCFIRKSEFKLPKDPSTPIIMVGPGTGLAPFRGFLQWRKHHFSDGKLGPAILFFGCRHSEIDYLYREELEAAEKEGYLTTLVTAFSREQKEKVYVQHRLQERSEELYHNYLKKKGVIYVCGDATQMAKDVMKAIKQIYEKYEGKTEKEAENIVAEMRKNHRYQEDVWHSY